MRANSVGFDRARWITCLHQLHDLGHPLFSPAVHPDRLDLLCFDRLDSTNKHLWHLLAEESRLNPRTKPIALVAHQQTAGKGQWGRQWVSQSGGLYLSVALQPNLPVADAAQLTLCSAWGIAIALQELPGLLNGNAEKLPVKLKWLNDLVLQGRKLGGILTETRLRGDRIHQAVVGVGVNWRNPVPDPGINLQHFWQSYPGTEIDCLEMVGAIVLAGILGGYSHWQQVGMAAMLPSYLDLLVNLGQTITWENQTGIVWGITPQGNLHIRLESSSGKARRSQDQSVASNLSQDIFLPPGSVRLGYPEQL